jgi:cytochrome b involved in lipid metabolism
MPGDPVEQRDAAAELLARLNGDGRYAKEIYTTYPGPHFAHEQTYDASEVVSHNDPESGYWTIINGRVYDLTRFAHLHPGGDKIIRSYAGLDATDAYRTARHHANPEVDAMLGLYEIGAVRRLDFGSSWSVAVSPDGLRLVPLKDTFRAWIGVLYTAVEMENAVANDYGIRSEPVTYDERADAVSMSPYKARLLFQTHRRFVAEHLSTLTGERFERLWAVTSGLDGEVHDVRWMRRAVADTRAGPAARGALELEAQVLAAFRRTARLDTGPDPAADDWLETTCGALEEADRWLMRDLKLALRGGLQVFERLERDTVRAGAGDLRVAAAGLPGIVEDYLGRVAALPRSPG